MLTYYSRSLDLLRDHFRTDILSSQDPWESDTKFPELLNLLPDQTLNSALKSKWESAPGRSSTQKWNDIKTEAESGVSPKLDQGALNDARQDIILEYTYPRIDAEVSKKLNHLLKSPFCVHPGTGRVCVPIDTKDNNAEKFDPFDVPTVTELLSEIDEWDAKNRKLDAEGDSQMSNASEATIGADKEKRVQDWEKTRLKPYVEYFRKFVNNLLNDEIKSVKRERDDGAAMEGMEY
jgi:DNA primase small subunit